ncbi:glycosyltransferase [Glaciecola siphonariae]|uniref:Glycosyltransferase n=1 Tax=Glaciecola siphonariae TaxID=521012 RepID=A0ABV9LU61_9ALTE
MKKILFSRDYTNYTGGHQKVRDYIGHFAAHPNFDVSLYLNNTSSVMPDLFENIDGVTYQASYSPEGFDYVFLAGMDWRRYLPLQSNNAEQKRDAPVVINLIQHVRHGDPKHPLHAFMKQKALRLCVSMAVKDAVEPYANGPCRYIRMGHNIPVIPSSKTYDLYILANKRPAWGKEIADWAKGEGLNFLLHHRLMPKDEVLKAMANADISVCLPNPTEGFYLPGIEAMNLSNKVVVPDCIANREYNQGFSNLIVSASCTEGVIEAIQTQRLRRFGPLNYLRKLRANKIVKTYSLANERAQLYSVLQELSTHEPLV